MVNCSRHSVNFWAKDSIPEALKKAIEKWGIRLREGCEVLLFFFTDKK